MGGHHHTTITVTDNESIRLSPGLQSVRLIALIAGALLLILAMVIGWATGETKYFFHAYLTSFIYFLSLALGALFFVPIHHLTRAGWSVTVRRVAELMMQTIIPMGVLFLPILLPLLFSSDALYHWNSAEAVANDELIRHKAPYLNSVFFTIRAILYFAAWILIARFYFKKSLAQDTSGDKQLTLSMQKYSALAIIIFSLTVTFAAFDWLMSLDAHWFSTIFGVYFFAGLAVSFFAFLTVVMFVLQQSGTMTEVVTKEHYHDLGKYIFGFTLFWGYIAFSQYLLIWYANIPEETGWYIRRQENGWEYVSLILLFGHFFIPFFGTMSLHVRRNKYVLTGWAVFILIMHWVDMYYLVMPQLGGPPTFGIIDLCCFLGIGGLFISSLIWFATDKPLVPLKDPRLHESLAFQNH